MRPPGRARVRRAQAKALPDLCDAFGCLSAEALNGVDMFLKLVCHCRLRVVITDADGTLEARTAPDLLERRAASWFGLN
jgi:hypothetical protein